MLLSHGHQLELVSCFCLVGIVGYFLNVKVTLKCKFKFCNHKTTENGILGVTFVCRKRKIHSDHNQ